MSVRIVALLFRIALSKEPACAWLESFCQPGGDRAHARAEQTCLDAKVGCACSSQPRLLVHLQGRLQVGRGCRGVSLLPDGSLGCKGGDTWGAQPLGGRHVVGTHGQHAWHAI